MTDQTMVCANHPHRETTLRCNRCEKPICPQCAVHTPVGYRCKECVRRQQKEFETTRQIDYPIAGLISAVALGVAMYLLGFLGWWGIFIAPVVGGGVADIVHRAVGRRRSRYLPLAAVIGGALGILPFLWRPLNLFIIIFASGELGALGTVLLQVVVPMVIGGVILSTLYYRLRGIRL
ncbi:MAG: hypothetical protein JSV37_10420 [Anaerolineaceae bacterium]|nr:MAG: hypothetical protein JSV37_10420 [Anaerolineaceae bacterium]